MRRWSPDGRGWASELTEDWAQGRAAFGGWIVAGAVGVMEGVVPEGRLCRSLLTSFVGPVKVGSVVAWPTVLRSGRSLTHVEVKVWQGDTVRAVVLGAFGTTRAPAPGFEGWEAPAVMDVGEAQAMPFLPGLTPAFTQHFEYRWTNGAMPFAGASEPHVQGWCRPRFPSGGVGLIAALADAWPPPIWTTLTRPAAGSSVTWQLDVLRPEAVSDWWLYDARTIAAREGYTDFSGGLWTAHGELVATSRQCFAAYL